MREVDSPDREEQLVAGFARTKRAVDAIVGLIRERAAETERARRLPDEVVPAVRGTGGEG